MAAWRTASRLPTRGGRSFRIHPGARGDDGVPITAHDVVFTFALQGSQVGASYFFRVIESVEALDERHAFRLDAPLTHDHVTLIQYIAILPQHYWRPGCRGAYPRPTACERTRVKDVQAGRYI